MAEEKKKKGYTDEELLQAIRAHPNIGPGEWKKQHIKPSEGTIWKRFGSWGKARAKAGVKSPVKPKETAGVRGQ